MEKPPVLLIPAVRSESPGSIHRPGGGKPRPQCHRVCLTEPGESTGLPAPRRAGMIFSVGFPKVMGVPKTWKGFISWKNT